MNVTTFRRKKRNSGFGAGVDVFRQIAETLSLDVPARVESGRISSAAVNEAENALEMMVGLSDAARKIGKLVALIENIAGQADPRALVATIQAARAGAAGDAGEGSAHLAAEGKDPVTRTGQASPAISGRISRVQPAATLSPAEENQSISAAVTEIEFMAHARGSASTNSPTPTELEPAMGRKTETGESNIIIHPAAKDGWRRLQYRKFVTEQKNMIDAIRRAMEFLRDAPDEPRFYFIAFFVREYGRLLEALTAMRPDHSNYPTEILKFHARLSEIQERLTLSLGTLSENSSAN